MKLYFFCLPKVQDYSDEMSALQRKASEGRPRAYVSYVFCVSYEGVRICEDQCQTKLQNLRSRKRKQKGHGRRASVVAHKDREHEHTFFTV